MFPVRAEIFRSSTRCTVPMNARILQGHARERVVGFGLAALAALCWATGGLAAKWLFTPLDQVSASWPVPPLGITIDAATLSAARAVVAFCMLVVYLLARRRSALRIKPSDVPFLALFGVAGLAMVHFTYFRAISLTSVATAILLEYLAPVIVLVFGVIVLGDRFTWSLPVAVALSVMGCALVVGVLGGSRITVSGQGLGWGLASAVFFAGYTLMGRWAAHRYSAWTLLVYGLGAASLFWLIVLGGPTRVFQALADTRTLLAIMFIALFSTVIPFGAFLTALHHIRATEASVTSTLEPVIAAIAAWGLFGETLTVVQIVGGLLVVAAIFVAQIPSEGDEVLPPAG